MPIYEIEVYRRITATQSRTIQVQAATPAAGLKRVRQLSREDDDFWDGACEDCDSSGPMHHTQIKEVQSAPLCGDCGVSPHAGNCSFYDGRLVVVGDAP